jgi:hypothetical protein
VVGEDDDGDVAALLERREGACRLHVLDDDVRAEARHQAVRFEAVRAGAHGEPVHGERIHQCGAIVSVARDHEDGDTGRLGGPSAHSATARALFGAGASWRASEVR